MTRRTRRRFAHELYPEPGDGASLEESARYWLARASGLNVWGTDWLDLMDAPNPLSRKLAWMRAEVLVRTRHIALLADVLASGLTGQEAWTEAAEMASDETGEIVWDRAVAHGIDPDRIKPYPVVAEPDHHRHWTPRDPRGVRVLIGTIDGKESECPDCTEEVES